MQTNKKKIHAYFEGLGKPLLHTATSPGQACALGLLIHDRALENITIVPGTQKKKKEKKKNRRLAKKNEVRYTGVPKFLRISDSQISKIHIF